MEVQYPPDAPPFLRQTSDLLGGILGPHSSELVSAEWHPIPNTSPTHYRLAIRDFTDQVSTDFTADELQNPLHMKVRLYRLWGDLLQVRNNNQHEKAQLITSQMASSEGF